MGALALKPVFKLIRQNRYARLITKCALWIAGIYFSIFLLNTFVFTPVEHPTFGVSFSQKRATEMGLDWHANFTALAEDLQFKRFRLMSYWDLIENKRGTFDFKDLDWQMDLAARHGAKVSLAIGVRVPRWPECHEPPWAKEMGGNDWKQALYAYMQVVVERYKNHPALESWQLENEGLNNWFGTCAPPDRQRLIEEFDLMKKWDPDHPIIMTLSDQHGLPLGKPVPDQYGYSVYRTVWNDKIPPSGYATYPTPIWYHRLRALAIWLIQHRTVWIHELQMEPWGPRDTLYLTNEEQDKSMSVDQMGRMFKFGRQLGFDKIDLWGGEWWYWRKVNGDVRYWERVRQELRSVE